MIEEIISTIIEIMLQQEKEITTEELIDISGYEKSEISKGINILSDIGIVSKLKFENTNFIKLNKNIKAIQITKVSQIGVDFGEFLNKFNIEKEEKELALKISSQIDTIKNLEVNKRKGLLHKRIYLNNKITDGTYENLLLLMEATNTSLYEYIEELSKTDDYLKLLIDIHQQAEKSLNDYAVANIKNNINMEE